MKQYFVYILTSKRNGTLYIGVTSDIKQRIFLHREGKVDGFTKKYCVHTLVFYEVYEQINEAIAREKQLKEWKRDWKLELIESKNSNWKDLYDSF